MQGSELGEGSFATVEECVLRGQRVAVKRLRAELVTNLDEVECFLAEGMTLSKLHHPCASLHPPLQTTPPCSRTKTEGMHIYARRRK